MIGQVFMMRIYCGNYNQVFYVVSWNLFGRMGSCQTYWLLAFKVSVTVIVFLKCKTVKAYLRMNYLLCETVCLMQYTNGSSGYRILQIIKSAHVKSALPLTLI
jgi:heme exporter protein D